MPLTFPRVRAAALAFTATLALSAVASTSAGAAPYIDPSCSLPAAADGSLPVSTSLKPLPAPVRGTPFVPRPGGRPVFGLADSSQMRRVASPTERARIAAGVGARTARIELLWAATMPSPDGHMCFSETDRDYRAFVQAGVRPSIVVTSTARWSAYATGECPGTNFCRTMPSVGALDEYAATIAAAARRYPLAAWIEIGNEPNLEFYWGAKPDGAHYARVLRAVRPAVNAANSNMRILAFGLSPVLKTYSWNGIEYQAMSEFLAAAYHAGISGTYDGVSVHLYEQFQPIADSLSAFQAGLAAGGDPDARIVVSETGYHAARADYSTQAARMIWLYGRFAGPDPAYAASDRVDAFDVYATVDLDSPAFGVVESKTLLGFVTKPLFCQFRSQIAQIGGSCPLTIASD